MENNQSYFNMLRMPNQSEPCYNYVRKNGLHKTTISKNPKKQPKAKQNLKDNLLQLKL